MHKRIKQSIAAAGKVVKPIVLPSSQTIAKPLVVGSTVNEYYGIAMMLSDDEYSMCCLLQIGTGNTKETSNLVERWFPYSAMKSVITNKIDDEFYVRPEQFFKVKIIEGLNSISYEFYQQEETQELVSLFEKPNYFEGLNTSFLNEV
jgi:hypothetical protein